MWKWFGGLTVFILGGVVLAGFQTGLKKTNSMDFCVSCHSMEIPYKEYQDSAHYNNRSGVQATCADCHVPQDTLPKLWAKVRASKDVYHYLLGTIDTKEKFEERREHMAETVQARMAANDSRTCRNCHESDNMALEEQSDSARKKHQRAEAEGKTCISCHKGIAHELPTVDIQIDDSEQGLAL